MTIAMQTALPGCLVRPVQPGALTRERPDSRSGVEETDRARTAVEGEGQGQGREPLACREWSRLEVRNETALDRLTSTEEPEILGDRAKPECGRAPPVDALRPSSPPHRHGELMVFDQNATLTPNAAMMIPPRDGPSTKEICMRSCRSAFATIVPRSTMEMSTATSAGPFTPGNASAERCEAEQGQ